MQHLGTVRGKLSKERFVFNSVLNLSLNFISLGLLYCRGLLISFNGNCIIKLLQIVSSSMSIFFQEFRLKHYAGDVTYCVNGKSMLQTILLCYPLTDTYCKRVLFTVYADVRASKSCIGFSFG